MTNIMRVPASNIRFKAFLNLFLVAFTVLNCGSTKDFYMLPAMVTQTSFNAVIEIPAGTNKKYEYNTEQKAFIIDTENGVDRVIDFLPYLGNYGFIPSTLSKNETGGDGDALDVLVLAESAPTQTVIEILPIAVLKLIDDSEKDYKIIAVPKAKDQRVIDAKTYKQLATDYPSIIKIIELWFLNYNINNVSSVEGWGDEQEALKQIQLHLK